jgi:hypothetical protein
MPGIILRDTPESTHCCGRRDFQLWLKLVDAAYAWLVDIPQKVQIQLFEASEPLGDITFATVIYF